MGEGASSATPIPLYSTRLTLPQASVCTILVITSVCVEGGGKRAACFGHCVATPKAGDCTLLWSLSPPLPALPHPRPSYHCPVRAWHPSECSESCARSLSPCVTLDRSYSGSGATVCLLCATGHFSTWAAASCTACPAGTSSPAGASACTSCRCGAHRQSCARCACGNHDDGGVLQGCWCVC